MPLYPIQAKESCIEGWVVVGYTITTEGDAIHHRVLKSSPSDVFNESALAAAKKLYNNWLPYEDTDISFKFTYKLSDEDRKVYCHHT